MTPKNTTRLVVLDFDGTIGDTQTLIISTMQKTIARLHLPARTPEQCAAMIGLPLKQTFTNLIEMSDEMGDLCAATYRRIFEEDNVPGMVPVFPHVLDTMRRLHADGRMLTIASSRSTPSLMGFVKNMQLETMVSLVMSCDDIVNAKPHPEMVLKTLERTGCLPEETVVVGDTKYDILMGRRAGCRTVGVGYGNGSKQELEEAGADHIIDDFAQLLELV